VLCPGRIVTKTREIIKCVLVLRVVYGNLNIPQIPEALLDKSPVDANVHPKWLLYSGLFVLLKQKLRLSSKQLEAVPQAATRAFAALLLADVRSFV
jgi:hypothetical protein